MTDAAGWLPPGAVIWPMRPDAIRVRMTDRAIAAVPAVIRATWPQVQRRPAGSPARRRLLTRVLGAGWAAFSQRDWAYLERLYHPEVLIRSGGGVALELPPLLEGWDAFLDVATRIFDEVAVTYEARDVLDFGGPLVAFRYRAFLTGNASGITAAQDTVSIYEIREGLVGRQWTSADTGELDSWLDEARGR